MESMYFLIPMSLLVLLAATGLLVWAVHSGQYDDIEREAERILQDDDLPAGAEQREPASAEENGTGEDSLDENRRSEVSGDEGRAR